MGVTLAGEPKPQHITHVHGTFGVNTRDLAVEEAERGINVFRAREPFCYADTPVEVMQPNNLLPLLRGRAYLRSKSNGTTTDDLLRLPQIAAPGKSLLMDIRRVLSR